MDESFREIRSELSAITARLSAIEAQLSGSAPAVPKRLEPENPPLERKAVPESPSEPIGGKLLAGAAVICFLLAAVFLIRLAVDNGWLTPLRQLGLAALFGASLIGTGFALRESDARYASILPGAGITILWGCVYAGYGLLQLYGETTTVVLILLTSGLTLALFNAFKQSYFLFVMVVGAYLMPVMLHVNQSSHASDQLYFLVWDLMFCVLSVRLGSRRILTLASYFALILFYLLNLESSQKAAAGFFLSLSGFQLLQFLLFTAFILRFSVVHRQPLTQSEAWYLFPVLGFFYATEYAFIDQFNPLAAPWAALFFAGLLVVAELFAQGLLKKKDLPSKSVVLSMVAIILFHALYLELLTETAQRWFSLLLLVCWPFAEKRGFRFGTYTIASSVYWLVIALEFFEPFQRMGVHSSQFLEFAFSALYAILLLSAYSQILVSSRAGGRKVSDVVAFVLVCGASTQAWLAADRFARLNFSGTSVEPALSALVALYAFLLMALARKYKDRFAANAALLTFLAISLKVLAVDLDDSAPLVRIGTLILVGLLLYGGGMISRQIPSGEESRG